MKTTRPGKPALLAASLLAVLAAPAAYAASKAIVDNGNDSGDGSLRAALSSGNSVIEILPSVSEITIATSLVYASKDPLTIRGSGQTVTTANNITLLAVTEGADLTVSDLDFQGPGGFDIYNRGDDDGETAGKGIFVDVRDDQAGTLNLVLNNVSVSGVANHGIHVSDCSLADDCGGGSGGGGEGSDASINVVLDGVTVDDAGNGKFDADGLRVDERGDGGINATISSSSFTGIGADGVELDEGNDGDVNAFVEWTDFSSNGGYCDPDIIGPYVPDPDEGEFTQEEMVTDDAIPSVFGSPDDSCIERSVDFYDPDPVTGIAYVEAFEFAIDTDDGIDIDEAGDGSLNSTMAHSTINDNLDEGVDYDEENDGGISASYSYTSATGNADDGYKHSEEDDGDVKGRVLYSSSTSNGGKGFVFEEENDGDLRVIVKGASTADNDDSDDTGIEAVQEDDGRGTLKVRDSEILDGIDTDGVDRI
ncbi:MAG: hypothetical protein P8Z33_12020 [Gammaproteobacteria bacterium]|jgi:hypothetical protein